MLILVGLTLGTTAAIRTVEMLNEATAVMEAQLIP